MYNPVEAELVAREQTNDRLRQAEQSRLAKIAMMGQPTSFNLRAYLRDRLMAVWHMFKALAQADKTNRGSEMRAGRHRP